MGAQVATSGAADAAGVVGLGFLGAFQMMCCFGYLLMVLLVLSAVGFWIYALIDVLQRTDYAFPQAIAGRPNPNERLIWTLVVLFTGWVGALVYYFVVMKPYPRYPRMPR